MLEREREREREEREREKRERERREREREREREERLGGEAEGVREGEADAAVADVEGEDAGLG